MLYERRRNLSRAIYEIGKFVFSGIVIGFVIKYKDLETGELIAFAIGGTFLTSIIFTIAYLTDKED